MSVFNAPLFQGGHFRRQQFQHQSSVHATLTTRYQTAKLPSMFRTYFKSSTMLFQ